MARAMVLLRLGIGLAALTLIAVAINVMGSSVSSLHVSTSTVGISLNPYPVGISLNPTLSRTRGPSPNPALAHSGRNHPMAARYDHMLPMRILQHSSVWTASFSGSIWRPFR